MNYARACHLPTASSRRGRPTFRRAVHAALSCHDLRRVDRLRRYSDARSRDRSRSAAGFRLPRALVKPIRLDTIPDQPPLPTCVRRLQRCEPDWRKQRISRGFAAHFSGRSRATTVLGRFAPSSNLSVRTLLGPALRLPRPPVVANYLYCSSGGGRRIRTSEG